jgi:hypothetical protein
MAGELLEGVQEVVSAPPGGVESNEEGDGTVSRGEVFEALSELGVAVGRLGELQFVGCGLVVFAEEGGVVAVARGVDAAADADGWAVAGRAPGV